MMLRLFCVGALLCGLDGLGVSRVRALRPSSVDQGKIRRCDAGCFGETTPTDDRFPGVNFFDTEGTDCDLKIADRTSEIAARALSGQDVRETMGDNQRRIFRMNYCIVSRISETRQTFDFAQGHWLHNASARARRQAPEVLERTEKRQNGRNERLWG